MKLAERAQQATMLGAKAAQVPLEVAAQCEIRRADPAHHAGRTRGCGGHPGTMSGNGARRHGKRTWSGFGTPGAADKDPPRKYSPKKKRAERGLVTHIRRARLGAGRAVDGARIDVPSGRHPLRAAVSV
jgi:hypothetical protein